MVTLVVPQQVPRVIAQDADDDQVHLHSLGGNYQGV
jgi:hypothetical protein